MKIWKYMLWTVVASVGLTACLKGDGWEEHDVPVPEPVSALAVELSTPSVMGNGSDYVEVTVRYEGEPVTDGVKFYTNDKSLLDEAAVPAVFAVRAGEAGPYDVTEYFELVDDGFRLKVAYVGLFTFWAEYKGDSTVKSPESVKAVPEGLYAELAKTTVVADGRDSAEVLVYHQGRQVTSGVKFFDTNDNPADEFFTDMRYRTTTVGEFSFYVAYGSLDTKTDPLTVTAVEPDVIDVPATGLFVYLSSTVVRADGKDAVTVKVFFDGAEITDEATCYRLPDNTEVDLSSGVYTTTETGTFSFWVSYKTENTFATPSTITAVDFAIPERPTDPNPSSTNFVRRVQVLQFTGTGCGFCPLMMTTLRNLKENQTYADKFLVAACHSYNASDPMYLGSTGSSLASAFGVNSYPSVVMDMRAMSANSTESYVRNLLESNYNRADAFAGIAVHSELSGNTVEIGRAHV